MTVEEEVATTIPGAECAHRGLLDESLSVEGDICRVCGDGDDLRVCMTCGHVACSESGEGHDADHWDETGHPFVRPHPDGERESFLWCFECEAYLD